MSNKMECNGILILDTCVLVNFLEGRRDAFDWDDIRKWSRDNGYLVTISVYTLYELVQKKYRENEIENIKLDLMKLHQLLGEYWVLNPKGCLDDDSLIQGVWFLFDMKIGKDTMVEFHEKRCHLRERVYRSLFKKMYFFASAIGVLHLSFLVQDRKISMEEFVCRARYVDNFFDNFGEAYNDAMAGFYSHEPMMYFDRDKGMYVKDMDMTEMLDRVMDGLINKMLVLSKIDFVQKGVPGIFDADSFRMEMEAVASEIVRQWKPGDLRALAMKYKRVAKWRDIYGQLTKKMPPVHRLAFEYMLGKVVGNGRYGKLFNNAFVDMANLCLVESGVKNAIFVTTDTEWVKLIRQKLSVDALAATRDFYDRFYRRK